MLTNDYIETVKHCVDDATDALYPATGDAFAVGMSFAA